MSKVVDFGAQSCFTSEAEQGHFWYCLGQGRSKKKKIKQREHNFVPSDKHNVLSYCPNKP